MTLPKLTPEQRNEALKKAITCRQERAQIKKKLKTGEIDPFYILEHRKEPCFAKIRLVEFLKAIPNIGKTKTANIIEELGTVENRRLNGLGEKQVNSLKLLLSKYK